MNRFAIAGFTLIALLLMTVGLSAEDKAPKPVTISASALTADELAMLVDAHIWKFDLAVPGDARSVSIRLVLNEKGRAGEGFGTALETSPVGGDAKSQVIVGIIPLGGSIHEAEKVRVVISAQGSMAAGVQDNPLRNFGIGGPGRGSTPQAEPDGSFVLIGGYSGNSIAMPVSQHADKFISLHIVPKQ